MDTQKINDAVFSLIRFALFGQQPERLDGLSEETWNAVYEELKVQRVHALLEPLLGQLPISGALRQRWSLDCMQSQVFYHQLMTEQQTLLALLEAHGIPAAVIKGSAAGVCYPQPELRCAGDIDVLVRLCDFDRAAALLAEHDYPLAEPEAQGDKHRNEYLKNGVCIELHRWVKSLGASDEALIALLGQGVDERVFVDSGGYHFPMLPLLQNGLVLLLHINQHLRRGLGLRQLIDWMLFVDRYAEEPAFAQLLAQLQALGLGRLTEIATATCQRYLGLRTDLDWCAKAPAAVCDELMAFLLSQGNFGQKHSQEEQQISYAYLQMKNPFRALRQLQRGGMLRWEAAQKHRVLRPFAWLYQGCSLLRRLRTDKKTSAAARAMTKEGQAHRRLLRHLELDPEYTITVDGKPAGGKA